MITADIDVGGTFTDGFFTRDGHSRRAKVLTTPHDLTDCFIRCLSDGAAAFGLAPRAFLRESKVVRLSTTLGTNTLLQRRGPKVGLLVTAGHERDLYSAGEPAILGRFLQPDLVRGIDERLGPDGVSVQTPAPDAVLQAVRELVDGGARIIAVSFAGSWRNPAHEQAVRAIVRERYPQHYLRSVPLQLGHEVSGARDDHARTCTVALNAYLHADLSRGLYRAEDRARDQGMQHPLLVVHADGGCSRVATTVAVQTLSSGPAAAVGGSVALARQLGLERIATADMGGTSLDVAVLDLSRGAPSLDQAPAVHGVPLAIPMMRTESVGAGGGSIARVEDGSLKVGPQSAGATPGPACYDKGGAQPTVTDANLVLGFLDPDRFLGGRMRLNRQKAEDAITRRLARSLGTGLEETAALIRSRVDDTMADEVALRLRELGADPADFTLLAFGGGGPLHGCAIASRVGINRVVGFPFGSVLSAFGSSTADVRHRYERTLDQPLSVPETTTILATTLQDLLRRASVDMRGEGFATDAVSFDVEILLDVDGRTEQVRRSCQTADAARVAELALDVAFQALIDASRGGATLRQVAVTSCGGVEHWLPRDLAPRSSSQPEPRTRRPVRWSPTDDAVETPVFDQEALAVGVELDGPALIEAPDTSYAVASGWRAVVDAWGNVVMTRSVASSAL